MEREGRVSRPADSARFSAGAARSSHRCRPIRRSPAVPDLRPQTPDRQPAYTPYDGQPPRPAGQQAASGLELSEPAAPSLSAIRAAYPERRAELSEPSAGRRARAIRARSRAAPGYDTGAELSGHGLSPAKLSARQSAGRRRASLAPSMPASQPYPASSYNERARASRARPISRSELRRCELRREPARGRCELPGIELRSEFRRPELRQSEFRQAELRRCELPASRRASTRTFPEQVLPRAHELHGHQEPMAPDAYGARPDVKPIKASNPSPTNRRRITARCAPKTIRAGSCKPSTPSTISRRRSRSVRTSRPPPDAGFLRERAARCRFPR